MKVIKSNIQHKSAYRLYAMALLAILLFGACHEADHELTLEDALSQGKGRELISLYESKLSADPGYLPYQLNLSVMYALSVRLDNELVANEVERRKTEAIQIARNAFCGQLAVDKPNLEVLLHSGSTLAQVYAILGATNEIKGVFEELSKKIAGNKEARDRITHGKKLLAIQLKNGYPLDATYPNPFRKAQGLEMGISPDKRQSEMNSETEIKLVE